MYNKVEVKCVKISVNILTLSCFSQTQKTVRVIMALRTCIGKLNFPLSNKLTRGENQLKQTDRCKDRQTDSLQEIALNLTKIHLL